MKTYANSSSAALVTYQEPGNLRILDLTKFRRKLLVLFVPTHETYSLHNQFSMLVVPYINGYWLEALLRNIMLCGSD